MKTMKNLFGVVALMMFCLSARAQSTPNVAFNESYDGGTVAEVPDSRVENKDEENNLVSYTITIIVTPAEGYYITKNDIIVLATYPLKPKEQNETRSDVDEAKQTLDYGDPLELVGDEPEDLTAERTYKFTVPLGLGAWVTKAQFHTAELVLASDVKEIADNSLAGVTSIVIENGAKIVGLGENTVVGLTVVVPGNLYNEYKTTEGWKEANITIDESKSVKMDGVNFTEKNDFATFYSDKPVVVPSVFKAFTVSKYNKDGKLLLSDVGAAIPADTPVLLFTETVEGDDVWTVPYQEYKEEVAEKTRGTAEKNALQIVTDDNKTDEHGLYVSLGQVYMLFNDVFYFTQEGYIPVGGIYLDPTLLTAEDDEPAPAPAKARLYLSFEDTEDDDAITAIESSKFKVQSSKSNDSWYDLSGRRLNTAPTAKGVYINGGKKYIIK